MATGLFTVLSPGLIQILSSRQRIDRQIAFDMDDLLTRQPCLPAIPAPPHHHIDWPPVATNRSYEPHSIARTVPRFVTTMPGMR